MRWCCCCCCQNKEEEDDGGEEKPLRTSPYKTKKLSSRPCCTITPCQVEFIMIAGSVLMVLEILGLVYFEIDPFGKKLDMLEKFIAAAVLIVCLLGVMKKFCCERILCLHYQYNSNHRHSFMGFIISRTGMSCFPTTVVMVILIVILPIHGIFYLFFDTIALGVLKDAGYGEESSGYVANSLDRMGTDDFPPSNVYYTGGPGSQRKRNSDRKSPSQYSSPQAAEDELEKSVFLSRTNPDSVIPVSPSTGFSQHGEITGYHAE